MLSHARRLLSVAISRRAAHGLNNHHVLAINPVACPYTFQNPCQPTNLIHFNALHTILAQHAVKQSTFASAPSHAARSIWTSAVRASTPSHPRAQAQQRKSSEQGLYLVRVLPSIQPPNHVSSSGGPHRWHGRTNLRISPPLSTILPGERHRASQLLPCCCNHGCYLLRLIEEQWREGIAPHRPLGMGALCSRAALWRPSSSSASTLQTLQWKLPLQVHCGGGNELCCEF